MKTLKEKNENKKVREENKDVSDLNSLHTKIAMILQTFFFLFSQRKNSTFIRLLIIALMLLCLTQDFLF